MAEEHKRRVHYSGKYPKKFEEKYKEHNPEKYADTVAHVIEKGGTPAGMHISICVNEILDFLDIKPGQQGIDCTFGYGGHTTRMLEKLEGNGHVYALDVDPIESEKSRKRLNDRGYGDDILTVKLVNFRNIDEVAAEYGKFDFLLADLGVSSMQIDNPERGFSYKIDGPLDLRMNPQKGESAAERLASMDVDEIAGMLYDNSDEPLAEEIAEKIIEWRKSGRTIETTTDLRNLISDVVREETIGQSDMQEYIKYHGGSKAKIEEEYKDTVKKTCQRVFQALRIDVNQEFEALYELLEKIPMVMNPGGRIAILTFHSGEDRLVKKSFKGLYKEGVYSDFARDVIRPSAKECAQNPRAKSTKMRWAVMA